MNTDFFSSDDIFVLGHLGLKALNKGVSDRTENIFALMQVVRPYNAAPFIMQAMHELAMDRPERALAVLHPDRHADFTISQDEALALYLYVLSRLGRYDDILRLGPDYLTQAQKNSEAARHTIQTVLDEARAKAPEPKTRVSL